MPIIIPERLAKVEAVSLKKNSHSPNDELNMCVMEAVAYVAGEAWSDAPSCACPVITSFLVSWNDSLPNDAERDHLLKPLIPLIVGTRSTQAVEERRSYMALDWLIRVHTPKWLDMVPALHEQAKALRELDAIVDMAGATAAGVKVRIASNEAAAAWAAAWAAATAATATATATTATTATARATAWATAAATATARATAWAAAAAADADAAGAADAAWAAAGDAAWAAAAAGDAAGAWDVLKPIKAFLQASALNLVHEMIALEAS